MKERRFRRSEHLVHVLDSPSGRADQQIVASQVVCGEENLTVLTSVRWPGATYQRWTRVVLDPQDSVVAHVRAGSEAKVKQRMVEELVAAGYSLQFELSA